MLSSIPEVGDGTNLDATEALLADARRLPGLLKSRRLAMETAAIVRIAERLAALLRRRDPIAGRVELTKFQYVSCVVRGVCWALIH